MWKGFEYGGHGWMQKQRGYYTSGGIFVADEEAPQTLKVDEKQRLKLAIAGYLALFLVTMVMVTVTTSILVFRMLMTTAYQFRDHPIFNPATSSIIGSTLNATWLGIMNVVYGRLAHFFNELENHRTDSEAENSLMKKTIAFQFANSYGALFYVGKSALQPSAAGRIQGFSSPIVWVLAAALLWLLLLLRYVVAMMLNCVRCWMFAQRSSSRSI